MLQLNVREIGVPPPGVTWEQLRTDTHRLMYTLQQTANIAVLESQHRRKDGSIFPVEVSLKFVTIKDEQYVVSIARDITEHKRLEEQLLQSQKLESLGRLAGGVAHDFNNLLTAILGYTELSLEEITTEALLPDNLLQVERASERAADLTRQLLAFARRQTSPPQPSTSTP